MFGPKLQELLRVQDNIPSEGFLKILVRKRVPSIVPGAEGGVSEIGSGSTPC